MCLSPYFDIGCRGEGGQMGFVQNLLMQLFSLYRSKMEVSETYFYDIVNT